MSQSLNTEEYLSEDSFVHFYAKEQESQVSSLMNTMYHMGNIEKMDNIIEAGPGTGYMFQNLISRKKKSAQYTGIDINREFLQAAQQRLEHLEKLGNGVEVYNLPSLKIIKNTQDPQLLSQQKPFEYQNQSFNIKLQQDNAEQLQNFEENTFDGYFANLVIHHCDWQKCLFQAHRVLKSGGKICLGEFGDKMHELFFANPPQVEDLLKQLFGDNYEKKESNHKHGHGHGHKHQHGHNHHQQGEHKHDENKDQNLETTKNEEKKGADDYDFKSHEVFGGDVKIWGKKQIKFTLEKLGFTDILMWDQFNPHYVNEDNCIKYYLRQPVEPKSNLSQEEQKILRKKIYQEIFKPNQHKENDQDQPRGITALCIVATKI